MSLIAEELNTDSRDCKYTFTYIKIYPNILPNNVSINQLIIDSGKNLFECTKWIVDS